MATGNIHGKNAIIYLSPGAGAAAVVSEQNTYSIEMDFDLSDTSELGDTWATAVQGLLKWSGSADGNFDMGSSALFSAATGGVTCSFYLYPARSSMTQYYYGSVWVKLGTVIAGGIGDKAKTAISFVGDGALSKMP